MSPRQNLSRQKVLEKATELVTSRGWESLNLHELASELHIKPPSLYNHIGSMADLRYGISVTAKKTLIEQIKTSTLGKSGAQACLALARAYLDFSRANPGLLSAIATAPDRTDPEAARIDEEFLSLGKAILSEYSLSDFDAIHALRALRSASHGFAVLEQENGFGIDIDTDTSFEWMILKLIDGFEGRTD